MTTSKGFWIAGWAVSIVIAASFVICGDASARQDGKNPGAHSSMALDSLDGLEIQAAAEKGLDVGKVTADVATYRGRRAVHLLNDDSAIVKGNRTGGQTLAIVKGSDFKDGTIEVDLVGMPRAGSPPDTRGFVGLAFRVQDHGSRFEAFYLRFTNGRAEDQLRRNHSAQYVSEPDFPWFRLREENPGFYESYVDIEPGAWTRLKVVVADTKARLYVNGAAQPCLILLTTSNLVIPTVRSLFGMVQTRKPISQIYESSRRNRMLLRISVSLLVSVGILATVSASAQDQTKLVKIRDSIYMAETASNVYVVTTPAGNVVIDTAPAKWAQDAKKVLTAEVHGPVKYIILTHGHADHIGGIDLWKESGTQIIAQRNYVEFVNYVRRLDGFFAPRNAVAFNRPPQEVGPWAGNFGAKIDPTILFDETYEFTLGGIEFKLFSTPGETPDHLTVWIPEYKTAFIGDNYAGVGIPEPMSFPNLYAIRGTKPRWALDWIHSIETVLSLKPEVVLNGHGDPIVGNEEITRRLTRYRDAIQYVHDETVKGMNAGKDVFTLMREIKLPSKFDLSESFGKVSWSVRGIYEGYAGWFDGNPTTMYDSPPSVVYADLVKLAGGPEPLVRLALEKVEAGKPIEALHLTDVVLAYDPKNSAALNARIKALDYLEKKCENFVEDGWLQYGIAKAKEKLGTAN